MSLSGYCVNFLLFPGLVSLVWFCLVSPFSRYLAFLAADWSGLSVPSRFSCPLVAPLGPGSRLRCHSLLSLFDLFFRCPLLSLPASSVFLRRVSLALSRLTVFSLLSLLVFPLFLASDSSSRRLVRVVRALAPPFSLFLVVCLLLASPLGVVPGLSGRRLVRISSATLIFLFLSLFYLPRP